LVTLRDLSPVPWPRSSERSVEREQLRRRVLAFTGIWFLVAGMLAALGFSILLLASIALVLVGAALAGGLWLLRRYSVGQSARGALHSIERASRTGKARLDEVHAGQRVRGVADSASRRARTFREARQRKPAAVDPHRQARRLNKLGAQLRRDGEYEQAVEQHRAALEIVRELGDRRAEALTLNNLALALVHTGGVAVAVQDFERSLLLLRELGDEELEGQVIANLGIVRRRQGRDEDAESLLNEALDKLPPESSAYRQVEEQLRRAS
jgi:tetratricopeptide (TPR) repeat protein